MGDGRTTVSIVGGAVKAPLAADLGAAAGGVAEVERAGAAWGWRRAGYGRGGCRLRLRCGARSPGALPGLGAGFLPSR